MLPERALAAFRTLLGADRVFDDAATRALYAADETPRRVEPEAVLFPASHDDVAGREVVERHLVEARDDLAVGDDIADGRLVSVLDPYVAPPTRVYCVFPARKHLPLRVRLFVDFVKASFSLPPLTGALAAPQLAAASSQRARRPQRG